MGTIHLAIGSRIRRPSWQAGAWVKLSPAIDIAERVRVAHLTVAEFAAVTKGKVPKVVDDALAQAAKDAGARVAMGRAQPAKLVADVYPDMDPAQQHPVLTLQDGTEWKWTLEELTAGDWELAP